MSKGWLLALFLLIARGSHAHNSFPIVWITVGHSKEPRRRNVKATRRPNLQSQLSHHANTNRLNQNTMKVQKREQQPTIPIHIYLAPTDNSKLKISKKIYTITPRQRTCDRLVPSEIACLASSSGRMSLTEVWILQEEMVDFFE